MDSVIQFVAREKQQSSEIDDSNVHHIKIDISDTNQNNAGAVLCPTCTYQNINGAKICVLCKQPMQVVERQVSYIGNFNQMHRQNSLRNQFEANQHGGSLAKAVKATQLVALSLVLALTCLSIASLDTWATATDAANCRDAPTIGLV